MLRIVFSIAQVFCLLCQCLRNVIFCLRGWALNPEAQRINSVFGLSENVRIHGKLIGKSSSQRPALTTKTMFRPKPANSSAWMPYTNPSAKQITACILAQAAQSHWTHRHPKNTLLATAALPSREMNCSHPSEHRHKSPPDRKTAQAASAHPWQADSQLRATVTCPAERRPQTQSIKQSEKHENKQQMEENGKTW